MTGRADRGFILATTLLVMTMLTVMLTAAFVMVSAEYRSTNGSYSTTRALNFAQAGLQEYFSQAHTFPAGDAYDSTRYTYSGGYADVVARKLRDSITGSERAVWIVYATGQDTTRTLTTNSSASRVVAQLATLQTGSLPAAAAMVAANGVQLSASGSNPINGFNTGFDVALYNCYTPSPPNAPYDTIGLYTVVGGYGGTGTVDVRGELVAYDNGDVDASTANTLTDLSKLWTTSDFVNDSVRITAGAGSGQRRRISANTANVLTVSSNWSNPNPNASSSYEVFGTIRYLSTDSEVIDTTHIDWEALVAGEFTPDYYGTLPASGNTQYQSHYFTDNVTIPSGTRRGMIVTQGNVTLAANSHWDGIIIAGGRLDANVNGTFYVHGMVITGLNRILGQNVSANQLRRGGTRIIQWDYCYAKASIASLNYLVPVSGTFTDSWKTY